MEIGTMMMVCVGVFVVGGPLIIWGVAAFLRALFTRRWLWPLSIGGITAGILLYICFMMFFIYLDSISGIDLAGYGFSELNELGVIFIAAGVIPGIFMLAGLVGLLVWVVYCVVTAVKKK